MTSSDEAERSRPPTGAELIARLGPAIPPAETVAPEAVELVERVRDLIEAVVLTDLPAAERGAIATEVAGLVQRLRAAQRADPVQLVRHADGWVEHLTNAGSGRLNPQAPRVEFPDDLGTAATSSDPTVHELTARCIFTAAHGGSPGRVHGGPVAALLDQVVGIAAVAVGRPGLTAELTVRYRRPTPYGVPVEVRARYVGRAGRRHVARGELYAGGEVTAEATAVFIEPRSG